MMAVISDLLKLQFINIWISELLLLKGRKKNLQQMRVSTAVSIFVLCTSVSIVKPLQVVKIIIIIIVFYCNLIFLKQEVLKIFSGLRWAFTLDLPKFRE